MPEQPTYSNKAIYISCQFSFPRDTSIVYHSSKFSHACRSKTLAITASAHLLAKVSELSYSRVRKSPSTMSLCVGTACLCTSKAYAAAYHVQWLSKSNMFEQIRFDLCNDRMCCGEEKLSHTCSGWLRDENYTRKKLMKLISMLGAWGRVCKPQEQVSNALLSLFTTYASSSNSRYSEKGQLKCLYMGM